MEIHIVNKESDLYEMKLEIPEDQEEIFPDFTKCQKWEEIEENVSIFSCELLEEVGNVDISSEILTSEGLLSTLVSDISTLKEESNGDQIGTLSRWNSLDPDKQELRTDVSFDDQEISHSVKTESEDDISVSLRETKIQGKQVVFSPMIAQEQIQVEDSYRGGVCSKSFSLLSSLTQRSRTRNRKQKLHICTDCKKSFSQLSSLTRHFQTHGRKQQLHVCTNCNKTFSQLNKLRRHNCIQTGERLYTCTVCQKSFAQSYLLASHVRGHSVETPNKCAVCKMWFKDVTRHVCTQVSEKIGLYTCTICKESFTTSASLSKHVQTHSENRVYNCEFCRKLFSCALDLASHKRVHNFDKPAHGKRSYTCTVCKKSFSQLIHLTVHMRSHTGERPYACTVCNKTFNNLSNLATHTRQHTGERPYTCKVCNKSFHQLWSLKSHARTHTGERPYRCTECDKTFTQSSSLRSHERTHHN